MLRSTECILSNHLRLQHPEGGIVEDADMPDAKDADMPDDEEGDADSSSGADDPLPTTSYKFHMECSELALHFQAFEYALSRGNGGVACPACGMQVPARCHPTPEIVYSSACDLPDSIPLCFPCFLTFQR